MPSLQVKTSGAVPEDLVILVDTEDNSVGVAEKRQVHEPPGRLHRAISTFLFNDEGLLLLQQRSAAKHHFKWKWSNTCCTHPRPGEGLVQAGERRLREELGITASVEPVGSFTYRAVDPESSLVEHEYDHVLIGRFNDHPEPDPREVGSFEWWDVEALRTRLCDDSGVFTPWLGEALDVASQGLARLLRGGASQNGLSAASPD